MEHSKSLKLTQQFQKLSPTERKACLSYIMMMCGGPAHVLAEVLEIIGEKNEKISCTTIGSKASEVLLEIAFNNPATPFWKGCVDRVPSEKMVMMVHTLTVELDSRKRKVKEKMKSLDWMDLETLLKKK